MAEFNKDDFLKNLRKYDALRDEVFYAESEEERPIPDSVRYGVHDRQEPDYSDALLDKLHPKSAKIVDTKGYKLYAHQHEAIERALSGEDVILEAPTASGKTLAFAIPMFDCLLKDTKAHALLLYPMKALSKDQRTQLHEIGRHDPNKRPWFYIYDGDTDKKDRQVIRRRQTQVPGIITTPEMLNASFLAHNDKWDKFLKTLRFLVIDEVHEYRGFFGSNMALLLRRFLHHLASLGVKPQIFMASATCANPLEHAENLTGRKFSLVSAKQKMRPRRHFFFVDPKNIPSYNFYNIFRLRIVKAARAYIAMRLTVLIFCPSIKFLNDCLMDARSKFDKEGLDKKHLASYFAGMTDEAKEKVRRGLRNGKIRIVFSTNALELGIDIAMLDGVILAGFPNNVMSAWQRVGRAGRSWDSDAFVLFYASNNVSDKFYAQNLDTFLVKPFDALTANPANDELMNNHVVCFPYEAGGKLHASAPKILGEQFYNKTKSANEDATPVAGNWRPHINLLIRGGGGKNYELKVNGEVIGSISEDHKFRDAYISAIYTFEGKKYRVESHSASTVTLRPCSEPVITEPKMYSVLNVKDMFDGFGWGKGSSGTPLVSISHGKIEFKRHYNGYKLYREDLSHEKTLLEEHPDQGIRSITSHAIWWNVAEEDKDSQPAILALAQMVRIGALFYIPCDRHDVNAFAQKEKGQEIYLYESYPGGIGIVKAAFTEDGAVWRGLMKTGSRIAQNCSCSNGCPNCIDFRYSQGEDAIDKRTGIELADMILEATKSAFDRRIKNGTPRNCYSEIPERMLYLFFTGITIRRSHPEPK